MLVCQVFIVAVALLSYTCAAGPGGRHDQFSDTSLLKHLAGTGDGHRVGAGGGTGGFGGGRVGGAAGERGETVGGGYRTGAGGGSVRYGGSQGSGARSEHGGSVRYGGSQGSGARGEHGGSSGFGGVRGGGAKGEHGVSVGVGTERVGGSKGEHVRVGGGRDGSAKGEHGGAVGGGHRSGHHHGGSHHHGDSHHHVDSHHHHHPRPYQFDYEASDEQGNVHYRSEERDESGTVRGTYGYTDNQGLYRVVEYVADANGFRADIRTNEPGTDGKQNPAGVHMHVEKPPPWIQERYTRVDGGGYGGSGGSGGQSGGGFGGGSGYSSNALCAVDKKLCR